MPDGLIREVRPDLQPEVILATRFDRLAHSMSADPCDRKCGCQLNVGRAIHDVATLKERQAAAAEKNIV